MYRPVSFFVGLRYTRAKRRNHFISFISLVSMIGIALGITVLITVLSVMNGFDREIRSRVFSIVPPVTLSTTTNNLADWQAVKTYMKQFPDVTHAAPFVNGQVLLNFSGSTQPAMILGVLADEEKNVSQIARKMVKGSLTNLTPGTFGIVLGENLASSLNANVGDKITVVTPQVSLTPAGAIPRFKRFTVVGIFNAGNGFGFDRSLGFVQLADAQKLLGLGGNVTGLHLSVKDVLHAPQIAKQLQTHLLSTTVVTSWADQFGEFFHAVQLEKTMMFFILLLIIAVAAFNLVSTLMMVVNEKESDIAILRTFGATPRMIMFIFMVQGSIIGVFGTLLGLIGGLLLAANVTVIVNILQNFLHIQFLSSNVYFVDYLPSHIEFSDVFNICGASLLLSLLATIYPAHRASRMDPVESLRYE